MMVTRQVIKESAGKGAYWLKKQQNEDGSYGKWAEGSTCLAIIALYESGIPSSDPAVKQAVEYVLRSAPDDTYFLSLSTLALAIVEERTVDVIHKMETSVNQIIAAQFCDPLDLVSYGGWGEEKKSVSANGLSTQYAVLALRSASTLGITIPQETWRRVMVWYHRNYEVLKDGSFVYSLDGIDLPKPSRSVRYAMTAAAVSSLLSVYESVNQVNIRQQIHSLLASAIEWLDTNLCANMSWEVLDSWCFYYLHSLTSGYSIAPGYFPQRYGWIMKTVDLLQGFQQQDGRWTCEAGKTSTDVIYTSLALFSLNRAVSYDKDVFPQYLDDVGLADVVNNSEPIMRDGNINKKIKRRIRDARFPLVKTFDDFDFSFAPGLDAGLLTWLGSSEFIIRKESVVFMGNPGTGKTHLAIALGRKACENDFKVRFFTAAELAHIIYKAQSRRTFPLLLSKLKKLDLIIIDELSYLTLPRFVAEGFFQIVANCDEQGSMIITTNYTFDQWHKILGDTMITAATVDRLMHRTYIFDTHGPSYRIAQGIKMGYHSAWPPISTNWRASAGSN